MEFLPRTVQKSNLIDTILDARGIISSSDKFKFLNPQFEDLYDYNKIPNLIFAKNRIQKAIDNNEKIVIYGDYDCDGIGAIAILYLALTQNTEYKNNKNNIFTYIPNRFLNGYGLTKSAIDDILKSFKPDLFITVDCGITSVEEVDYIKEKGIDVIITDHHQKKESIPDCIVVNPVLDADNCPPYCGAGVAFMLVLSLFGKDKVFIELLPICCISTVTDLVPLKSDNRIIVKLGLDLINQKKCRYNINLLIEKALNLNYITTKDISFTLGPIFNASGRIDSALLPLQYLITDDYNEMNLMADRLIDFNNKRKDDTKDGSEKCLLTLKNYDFSINKVIVIYDPSFNEGTIGIIASKIKEKYNLPCIIFTDSDDDTLKGSARSIDSINIIDMLDYAKEYIIQYGGHKSAAGLSIEKRNLNIFINKLNEYIMSYSNTLPKKIKYYYDFKVNIQDIDNKFINDYLSLSPFGVGNPKPILYTTDFRFIDSNSNSLIKHRIKGKNMEIISFNKKDKIMLSDNYIDFTFTLDKNYYMNYVTNQLIIKDFNFSINSIDNNYIYIKNYYDTFVSHNYIENFNKIDYKNSNKPILYVTYNYSTFNDEKYSNLNKIVCKSNYKCFEDTICLAPMLDFEFYYYSKIIFLENVGNKLLEHFNQCNIRYEIDNNNYNIFCNINRDECLEIFKSINELISFNKMNQIFEHKDLKKYSKIKIYLALCIFKEINLIDVNESGYIVNNSGFKRDLNNSILYKLSFND